MSTKKITLTMSQIGGPEGLHGSLVAISKLSFPGVPLSFLMDVAENREKVSDKAKLYAELSGKLLRDYASKDDDG